MSPEIPTKAQVQLVLKHIYVTDVRPLLSNKLVKNKMPTHTHTHTLVTMITFIPRPLYKPLVWRCDLGLMFSAP